MQTIGENKNSSEGCGLERTKNGKKKEMILFVSIFKTICFSNAWPQIPVCPLIMNAKLSLN